MGADPRKRQKKLEKRAAKRKDHNQQLIRSQNVGVSERLAAAARFPVLDCWIGDGVQEEGLGWVVLSREHPSGRVAVANFLVDRYCLGVKNVHMEVLPRSAYQDKYAHMRRQMRSHNVPPTDACKLLHDAVAYAHGLGLGPHADYSRAVLLFGEVNPAESTATFEFGKDGQPYFVSGPNETPERCRQILAILTRTCGTNGFHYLMAVGGPRSLDIEGMRLIDRDDAADFDDEKDIDAED